MSEIISTQDVAQSKVTKADLWKVFLRHNFTWCLGYNATKQMNVGFGYCLAPVIEKVYQKQEDKNAAYTRHSEYFLTQSHMSALNIGMAAAMEERNAEDSSFDSDSINAVKTASMSPLAAIGDSLFQGTLRPLFAGIAVSMITASNYTSAAGTWMFLIIMAALGLGTRYLGIFQGYKQGAKAVDMMQKTGIMGLVTKLSSIAAYVLIGGFAYSMVNVNLAFSFVSGETTISLMDMINGLCPGLLGLLLIFLCKWLMGSKKVNPTLLLFILLAAGIAGVYLGILA